MWLFNSSIGKKFIMALTGICLVLFVTFHVLMNAVAIVCPTAYNKVCMFLGANWYALVASIGLGALMIIHIIDAIVLTIQNRKARGNDRYAVNARPKSVEWSSQNMLVLGIVVLAFLGLHLYQFWARMQLRELVGVEFVANEVPVIPQAGTLFIQLAFQEWWTAVAYIIGFAALWFHMNHGFWSMWQTVGWNNTTWLPRLKCISKWWVSIVIALFTVQAVVFTLNARSKFYVTNPELVQQYNEMYIEHYESVSKEIKAELDAKFEKVTSPEEANALREENKSLIEKYSMAQTLFRLANANSLQPVLELIAAKPEKKAADNVESKADAVEEAVVSTGMSED